MEAAWKQNPRRNGAERRRPPLKRGRWARGMNAGGRLVAWKQNETLPNQSAFFIFSSFDEPCPPVEKFPRPMMHRGPSVVRAHFEPFPSAGTRAAGVGFGVRVGQPFPEHGGGDFGVELQRVDVVPRAESLLTAERGRSKMRRPARKGEGVAVPLEERCAEAEGLGERVPPPFPREIHGIPPDFTMFIFIYAGPKGGGDQLGTQANTQGGTPETEESAKELDFLDEERMFFFFVNPHGPAHDDERLESFRPGKPRISFPNVEEAEGAPAASKGVRDEARPLVRDVAEDEDVGLRPT